MATSALPFPRTIKPSLVEVGDTVKVTHRKENGIQLSMTGTVAKRDESGNTRLLKTAEGGLLLTWDGKENPAIHVLLLHRADHVQEPLALFDELADRMAG